MKGLGRISKPFSFAEIIIPNPISNLEERF